MPFNFFYYVFSLLVVGRSSEIYRWVLQVENSLLRNFIIQNNLG